MRDEVSYILRTKHGATAYRTKFPIDILESSFILSGIPYKTYIVTSEELNSALKSMSISEYVKDKFGVWTDD